MKTGSGDTRWNMINYNLHTIHQVKKQEADLI